MEWAIRFQAQLSARLSIRRPTYRISKSQSSDPYPTFPDCIYVVRPTEYHIASLCPWHRQELKTTIQIFVQCVLKSNVLNLYLQQHLQYFQEYRPLQTFENHDIPQYPN